jgi:hypothetical protein
MIPKWEKMYQTNTKCTKWSFNIQNVCKVFQMAIKSNLKPSKIYPNWDFGFENNPSGDPGVRSLELLYILCHSAASGG